MTQGHDDQGRQDVGLYEKILKRTEEILESGRKNLDDALRKASDELSGAGEFTREQADRISGYVRRDAQNAIDSALKAKDEFKGVVDPQRVSAGAQSVFARMLQTTSEKLAEWAEKSEQNLEYRTGEVTTPGTLTCKNCKEELHIKKTAKIPPCPRCHQTLFRKSF